jgi:hypothetical protein
METLNRLAELRSTLEHPRVSITAPLYVMNTPFLENNLESSTNKVNVARKCGSEAKGDLSSKSCCMGAAIKWNQVSP